MSLIKQIKADTVEAMKNKNKEKLSTLRLLVSELEKEKIELKLEDVSNLKDEQVQTVINRQIKKLNKEIEAYADAGRTTENQEAEKELLTAYLPKQLTKEEIEEEVRKAVSLHRNGKVKVLQPYLAQNLKGKADMKLVMQTLKSVQNENNEGSA